MSSSRRITVIVPPKLLAKAQLVTGAGIATTVRAALALVAAADAYGRVRRLRGTVRFSRTATMLKADG